MEDSDLKLLKKAHLFKSLTTEQSQDIRRKIIIKRVKKDEVILYEEDTNKFMYEILDGRIKVVQYTEDGKEIIIAIHNAGDSFGEISLIDGKTTTAAVLALEDAVVAIISKEVFYSVLYSNEKVLDNLLKMLCSRIRENIDNIKILNFSNASQRVKMSLIGLLQEHGEETPEGTLLDIRLTHQDIASMAGLARETVTRVIDLWQKNSNITVLKNRSILLSPEFLEEI
jgi:CRP/FNR family transcriptional regulator